MLNGLSDKEIMAPPFILGVLIVIAIGLGMLYFEAPTWSAVSVVSVLALLVGTFAPN
jgi:membrane protein YdbS with pleckstrin-like domain